MNFFEANKLTGTRRTSQQAKARIIILVMVCFLAGVALSALWFYRGTWRGATDAGSAAEGNADVVLSDSTKSVLHNLGLPVEVHFFSLLDPASVPASVRAFALRVDHLLSAYQQEGGANFKLIRFDSLSNSNAAAAEADGIKAFNIDKGDACYLGIAVAIKDAKESLASLAPEWEPALEADLTRTIAHVALAKGQVQAAAPVVDTAALEAVRRAIPNADSISTEEGTRLLREAAQAEFKQASQEMEAKVNEAQQNFIQAQNSHSEAEQQAALKRLQQVQAEQLDKLKEIAMRAKVQSEAFQQLKSAAH